MGIIPDGDAHLLGHLHDVQEVRGRAGDGGRAQILHQLYLAFGIAHPDRQDCGADALCAVV